MERDRDQAGRPRSARPRDGLGRPLPYGAAGVAREAEGVERAPWQTIARAQELFDLGRPFHAHEVFEDAWKSATTATDQQLWKALAQLAVGVTHRLRGNTVGAQRLLQRAAAGLQRLPDATPYGLDVAGLRRWADGPPERPLPALLVGDDPP